MRYYAVLHDAQQGFQVLNALYEKVKPWLVAGHKLELRITPERRTSDQNARLWAMLNEVSRQVEWYGQHLSSEEWKHVFSASLKKQKVVPGLDGGFVVLGQSTSKMTKAEFSELMELIAAFGAERGVQFLETAA